MQAEIPGGENSVCKGVKVRECMVCQVPEESVWSRSHVGECRKGSVGTRSGRAVCHKKGLHCILEDVGTLRDFSPGRYYGLGFVCSNLTLNHPPKLLGYKCSKVISWQSFSIEQ